jgi:ABC-type bacteriocin/lantibiotic exporter with double-glycine peptidase domain
LQGGTMVAVLGYMIWVEPVVALIGLAVYSPQMILVPLMQRRINEQNRTYAERVRELGDFVVENAETAEQSKDVPDGFRAIVEQMFEAKMIALRLKAIMKFIRNFINGLGPLSILVIGGWYVIRGETELGTLVAFLSGFERISGPWSEVIGYYRQASNARMKYRMLVDDFPDLPECTAPPPEPRFS